MAFVWLLSGVLLGERTGPAGIAGVFSIFMGLWVPVLGWRRGGIVSTGISARGFRAALLSAGFIAGYHFCYDRALEGGAEPFRLFAVSLSVSVPLLAANLLRAGKLGAAVSVWTRRPVFLLIAATVVYWSFILFLMGLESTGAGFAISLRNTSIFYALVLAHFSGERIQKIQIASCVLIFAGAILLGFAK